METWRVRKRIFPGHVLLTSSEVELMETRPQKLNSSKQSWELLTSSEVELMETF